MKWIDRGWREHNRAMAIDTVADIIEQMIDEGEHPQAIAQDLAESGYVRVARASRAWMYGKGEWTGPLVMVGGDEYGNWTLCFRLPGQRALIVALNVPLRRRRLDG
jgi:hypothetical protein